MSSNNSKDNTAGDVANADPNRIAEVAVDVVNAKASHSDPLCLPCDSDAVGDVVNAVPYCTSASAAPKDCDVPNAKQSSKQAPNRIINWSNLRNIVDGNLGNCKVCKSPGLRLVQTNLVVFSSTIAIHCDNCEKKEMKLYQEIKYGMRYLKSLPRKSLAERKIYKEKKNKIDYKLKTLRAKQEKHGNEQTVASPVNTKFDTKQKGGRRHTLDFALNIRAMLSAFYVGTGGYDIGGTASFLGIPGGRSFERAFHRHSDVVHNVILRECETIMDEAMNGEIIATIKEKLKGSYTDFEIEKYANNFITGKLDDLPAEIKTVGIAVSYDMGWNKRSTGRVYDSLSGHAFMIGCQTGNVIDMGVSKKKCSTCQTVNRTGVAVTHECNINSEGSSGAMESDVALRLTIGIHQKWGGRVFIKNIVSDDDSTMRAYL